MFGWSRSRWQQLSLPWSWGALELHANGNYALGPLTFDQSCDLEDVGVGEALVNKRAGTTQELVIRLVNGLVRRFKYERGQWWAAA